MKPCVDTQDWPHISYSTSRPLMAPFLLLITNPLIPVVATPSQKGYPSPPPQVPWTYIRSPYMFVPVIKYVRLIYLWSGCNHGLLYNSCVTIGNDIVASDCTFKQYILQIALQHQIHQNLTHTWTPSLSGAETKQLSLMGGTAILHKLP